MPSKWVGKAKSNVVKCGRCGKPISEEKAELCWWCHSYLCYECWDEHGHCGHTEAEDINKRAIKQYEKWIQADKEEDEKLRQRTQEIFGKCVETIRDLLEILDSDWVRHCEALGNVHGATLDKETSQRWGENIDRARRLIGCTKSARSVVPSVFDE